MSNPIPSWGTVSAAPHEFLIHIRRGEVVRAQQGGSCFRWPGDAVALVDTSVQRLQFTADQVTLEKTGVQVTGLAVFRIVSPLLAYRMLNLQEPEAVADILREMLLGATRRLVANLRLEECLTKRKDALATELSNEVAPVISGNGRVDDVSEQGWGIALDTIEIQDVRVLSEEVFSRLQAPYREALALDALQAEAEVRTEEARLAYERTQTQEKRRREQMALEEARLTAERQRKTRDQDHEQELAAADQQAELVREGLRLDHELQARRLRLDAKLADERRAFDAARERTEADAESEVLVAQRTAEAERKLGEVRAEMERLKRAAMADVGEGRLRELMLTETLPEVARAYADSFDRIVVTGSSDLSILGQGVAQVMGTLQAFGIDLGTTSDP